VKVKLRIRRAVAGDAATLTQLAHRAKAHWGYAPDWIAAWRGDLTLTSAYIQNNDVFVTSEQGGPVGMCAIEDHGESWSLEHVWVDPACQGRGIGRALVEHALGFARARRPGSVKITADPNAAGFYARMGALAAGTQPAPMPGAPDRVLPLFEFPPRNEKNSGGGAS
jgi:ribosomal protein S18 acetylase RimI-like enzyme